MKKLKAQSSIINGRAKSQKRKFYHTAFQLWGVNLFKETTTGTFVNSKSIYDVTGERSIVIFCH